MQRNRNVLRGRLASRRQSACQHNEAGDDVETDHFSYKNEFLTKLACVVFFFWKKTSEFLPSAAYETRI